MVCVIVLDDERIAMEGLAELLKEIRPDFDVHGFTMAEEALAFSSEHHCMIAFLDIEMFGLSGIDVARKLKEDNPEINIVFTTAYSNYALDAFDLHASGYLLKPIRRSKLEQELKNLRYTSIDTKSAVKIQTFGEFEVYVNEQPVTFKYNKTKELLAFLVDRRGVLCSRKMICAVLFGDEYESKRSYYNNIHADLIHTFQELDCENIILNERGSLGLNNDEVNCDFYHWLDGDAAAKMRYFGEYMNQYDWAETTNAWLRRERKK